MPSSPLDWWGANVEQYAGPLRGASPCGYSAPTLAPHALDLKLEGDVAGVHDGLPAVCSEFAECVLVEVVDTPDAIRHIRSRPSTAYPFARSPKQSCGSQWFVEDSGMVGGLGRDRER